MRIFVTGAAGLIGGEVARRLVARGHWVTAGIHSNPDVRGNDGTPVALAGIVPIDLAAPALGLDGVTAQALADAHDLILHCAATTRFDLGAEAYRATNVAGTAAILALAARADRPVLYVSTAYVCGRRDGPIGEEDPLPSDGFANGYEASKAQAETLVATASPRHVIARPSIVLGDSTTGAIHSFDTIYAAFKLIAEGRVRHMPARADATLDFVPIDHVAAGLVALAERIDAAAGGRFHLVSSDPVPVADWAAAIGAYPQFTAPTYVEPDAFNLTTLPPLERRLFARVAGLYSSYFQRAPCFDDHRFRALTGLVCPPTDIAYLTRLIDHCIAVGFLPAATGCAGNAAPAGAAPRAPTASRP